MAGHDTDESDTDHWMSRHRWSLGMVLAMVVGGGYVWRRMGRDRRISVDRVSERWLAEQQFEAGQHPAE